MFRSTEDMKTLKSSMKKNSILITIMAMTAVPTLAVAEISSHDDTAAENFYFPSTGVRVEQEALLLAIDDYLLPLRENVGSYLSTPECRLEPVLEPSKDDPEAPDQVASHFYGCFAGLYAQADAVEATDQEVRAAVAIANKVAAKSHEFMVAFVKDATKGVVAVGPDEAASGSCACN